MSTTGPKFSSKFTVYNGSPETEHREILVVEDSIVCFFPSAITYCLSGGKTADLVELIPALLDIYPSLHTVSWSCWPPLLKLWGEVASSLVPLSNWMKKFTTATGCGFISNLDSFWTRRDLFKQGGVHLSRNGTGILSHNVFGFIALALTDVFHSTTLHSIQTLPCPPTMRVRLWLVLFHLFHLEYLKDSVQLYILFALHIVTTSSLLKLSLPPFLYTQLILLYLM